MESKTFPDCWIFNSNRRKYIEGNSRPVWRYHWEKVEIVDETRISWISEYGIKVPKKGKPGVVFSESELDNAEYVHINRYKISQEVSTLSDCNILRKIEGLLHGRT